tara:strand:+ start:86 stop:628 length:543 start_codon:yes stop_codon:yes gene_type:complete
MFPNLKTQQVKTTTLESNYLGAGAHTVRIKNFKTSDEVPGYKGTPYFEFIAENDSGVAFLKFMGVDNFTSEAAARVRTDIFKSFLTSAGASTFDNPNQSASSIVGKQLEICLATREYWTTDKDTDKPVVKTRVEYKFSNMYGKKITFKDSFNKPLSAEDRAAYENAVGLSNNNNTVETPF